MMEAVEELRAAGASYSELLEARRALRARRWAFRIYYGGFEASDGVITVGALTPKTREGARRVLGIEDDASDTPGFDSGDPANIAHASVLLERIRALIRTRPVAEWIEAFEAEGVPVAPVHFPEDLADDPQVNAAGIMADLEHPLTGPQRVVGPIVELSETPTAVQRPRAAAWRRTRRRCCARPAAPTPTSTPTAQRGRSHSIVATTDDERAPMLPLDGLRAWLIAETPAAGFAGRLLLELGVSVELLEPPGGSPLRACPPFLGGGSQRRERALPLPGRGDARRASSPPVPTPGEVANGSRSSSTSAPRCPSAGTRSSRLPRCPSAGASWSPARRTAAAGQRATGKARS